MRSEIIRLKDQLLETQKTLLNEAEVLKYMSCEQCLLKSRAERLEKAAGTLKNSAELLDSWLKTD